MIAARHLVSRRLSSALLLSALTVALTATACTPDRERTDAQLYEKYCSECHGEDGRGDDSLRQGNEKVDLLASAHIRDGDREFVYRRVAYGYAQMPAYLHKLDPPDLERLINYVMTMQDGALAGEGGTPQAEQPRQDG